MEEDNPGEYPERLAEMMLLLEELGKKNRLKEDDRFVGDDFDEVVSGIGNRAPGCR